MTYSDAQVTEEVIADRNAQASDEAVRDAAQRILTSHLRRWGISVPEAAVRAMAVEVLRDTAWIRPAAPGCDCGAAGGQGLVPTASRVHADDCPAVAR